MMFGRFIVDAKYRTGVHYGLTDKRISILSGYFKRKIENVPLKDLGEITISTKSDGSGTIILKPAQLIYNWKTASYFHSATQFVSTQLEFIPNVKLIYDEILAAQKDAKNRP
ncbi:MAG: PH domain-containing protein [Candidatus Zixiibacteriota bacterium]|nr:MAG: PH domain-containing protein [candidate division Zixibacteria bacterium]